ncbi:hypothetical protein [uncultured Tenacibaculum sp.]|uniref:hypothetical protein n=1 Tax=uncultured Tenacibaculum sp. TaxID=174713 RepID=UPI0026150B67|nr:hypothetical protein [uncultured Tenacibaculum sp.]
MLSNTKLIKTSFVLGFTLLALAQISFSFTDTIELLKPIDFIHWSILIGIVLIIPGILRFSNGTLSKIGTPITMIGIISTIGMCAIDFVLWTFNDNPEARYEMYLQLVKQPAIWPVFISVGPVFFFVGLSLISFEHLKTNLRGVIILNIGSILTGLGGLILPQEYHFIIVIGYIIFSFGAVYILIKKENLGLKSNSIYNYLFVIGLALEMIGQILLTLGNDVVYAFRPIDYAHWSILLGAAFMLPKIMNFPNKLITYIGLPIAVIGAVSMIGMCILDFIWWNMTEQPERNELAGHLSQFPSIWKTFITTGPGFLNIGLLLLSFNYIKRNKIGVALIVLATIIIFFLGFIPYRLIYVYLISAIGYGLILFQKTPNEYQTK